MSNGFHIGQKVVCAEKRYDWPVTIGGIYEIQAICSCRCRFPRLHLGFTSSEGSRCFTCETDHPGFARWMSAEGFRPLDTLSEQVERIEKEGAPQVEELELVTL